MKKIFIILISLYLLISCNNKSEVMETENEKLVYQYFDYFNNHNWEKMAEMYTESAEFKDPTLGIKIIKQTRAQTIKKYAELNEIFGDLNDEIIQIYPSGNQNIIVEFVSSGTAVDGSKFQLPICTIFTIENGKITKDYTYFDNFEE